MPSMRRRFSRPGFTLLEVLIATAATLLMMVSLAQIFKIIGDSMKQGRAGLEMNNRLRSVIFKIRHDLNNLTVRPKPPADGSTGTGYFEYYEGSMTDYSCMLFDPNNAPDPDILSNVIRTSRFGDFDDILMYTARAGDSWFTGKVPLFVLRGAAPTNVDSNNNSIPDDLEPVTIAAQHAEIAIFAQPLVSNVGNENFNQGLLVENPNSFLDVDGNGIPDAIRLHYRTLLIRPDLNRFFPINPANPNVTIERLPADATHLIAQQQNAGTVALPTPLCDMSLAHNQCDLSIRRVFHANDGWPGGTDYVAANSLDDLMDPANRFAHVQVPTGTQSLTMPLLALGPRLKINEHPSLAVLSDPPTGAGFLHPAFALQAERAGEDIMATDVVAFDVKAYDSAVPIITMVGPDGIAGSLSDPILGASGSDDVVVTPNDPGYAVAASSTPALVTGYGGYVDLLWGRKVLNSARYYNTAPASPYLITELSGLSVSPTNGTIGFTESLHMSGKVLAMPNSTPIVMQPTFDSWTTRYESDGILQSERTGLLRGVVQIRGTDLASASPTWRQTYIDAATDGLDNNGSGGTDDVSELETRPPFPVDLRGVKVSVRIEDPATRQVKQMSAANEFVTQ